MNIVPLQKLLPTLSGSNDHLISYQVMLGHERKCIDVRDRSDWAVRGPGHTEVIDSIIFDISANPQFVFAINLHTRLAVRLQGSWKRQGNPDFTNKRRNFEFKEDPLSRTWVLLRGEVPDEQAKALEGFIFTDDLRIFFTPDAPPEQVDCAIDSPFLLELRYQRFYRK